MSDAVIFNGDATIVGDVDGQVIAYQRRRHGVGQRLGQRRLAERPRDAPRRSAVVGGDIASRFTPDIAPTATFDGRLRSARGFDVNAGSLTTVSRIFVWLATTVSSFLLGLLLVLFVPRAAEAVARTAAATARGVDRLRLPHAGGHPDRGVHRDRRPVGDPARRRRAAGARTPLLAGLHRGRVRAREAIGLRSGQVDAGVPRGLGHPARARADPGPREPGVAGRDRLGPRRAGHRGPRGRPPDGRRRGSGRRRRGHPAAIPPPPPIVSG